MYKTPVSDFLSARDQSQAFFCFPTKNVPHAYDYSSLDAFMLDRDKDSSYERLNKLIGLTSVKEQINIMSL